MWERNILHTILYIPHKLSVYYSCVSVNCHILGIFYKWLGRFKYFYVSSFYSGWEVMIPNFVLIQKQASGSSGEVGGLNLISTIIFIYSFRFASQIFLWNLERRFPLLLQDDSIRLQPKYRKWACFYFEEEKGGGRNIKIFIIYI